MTDNRRAAVIGGNRIPFARANGAYAQASNHDMLTATLELHLDVRVLLLEGAHQVVPVGLGAVAGLGVAVVGGDKVQSDVSAQRVGVAARAERAHCHDGRDADRRQSEKSPLHRSTAF